MRRYLIISLCTIVIAGIIFWAIVESVYWYNEKHWLKDALSNKYELFQVIYKGKCINISVVSNNGLPVKNHSMAIIVVENKKMYIKRMDFDYSTAVAMPFGNIGGNGILQEIFESVYQNGENGLIKLGFSEIGLLDK